MIKEVVNNKLEEVMKDSKNVVLVDFWATWCEPCKMISPILDELSEELEGKVEFVKVNADQNKELVSKYQISGIPTMLIFKRGELVDTLNGFNPKVKLLQVLNKYI
ncbi:thioredoxin [Clostridium manihotivorum]|uniref:Thioredoxin n=1 Tax=Clostridium manihotivorum TaxID=2320868 RepID=A0A3R5R1J2_9CLOT|nr:thioredoxin [Clostridium manihotivorum]QAA34601.1 thioredoxin [Clostridium manihotivorum]